MNRHAIEHKNIPQYIYPISRSELTFKIKAARGDIAKCTLVYWPRNSSAKKKSAMFCAHRDDLFDYYKTNIKFSKVARYVKYYFELVDLNGQKLYVTAFGLKDEIPEDGFFEYLYANGNDIVTVPEWAKGKVFYQIFPERYNNGTKNNDPPEVVQWSDAPTRENFFGGDILGIIQKLDYIKELGIDCIYLNPVFKGDFNHKYATTDYFQVDPIFGTNEDLKELVLQCHKRNIKIILDGVFNHCGTNFEPFRDLLENQEKSKYKNWFYIEKFPVKISHHNYECVGAYKWMPKLRTSNPEVREYVLKVMDYWIREAGIDGWRLDVADEVDVKLWQYARAELKAKYPEIILIGETWGSALKMLSGDQMDSAMNYVFRDAARDFFAKNSIDAYEFDSRINKMLAEYPDEINSVMYNLLDSHDTARFLTECGSDKKKFKLAAAFQMLFCGCPAIYYGDEVGMSGENDPGCRGGMVWEDDKQDKDLLEWYKKIIALRKSLPPVMFGGYISNICDACKGIYGFIRDFNEERVYVLLNNSGEIHKVNLPVADEGNVYEDVLSKEAYFAEPVDSTSAKGFYNHDLLEYSGVISLTLDGYSFKIIKSKMEE